MTNNKQQTAVDSIIEFCQKQMDNDSSIHKGVYLSIIEFCEEQAKAMNKEEIIEGYANGHNDGCRYMNNEKQQFEHAEQYYEQTYGGGEE